MKKSDRREKKVFLVVGSYSKTAVENAIYIILLTLFVSFTFWLIIQGGIKNYRSKKDLVYKINYCENGGEYCPFCEDKCICKLGWIGKRCQTLEELDCDITDSNSDSDLRRVINLAESPSLWGSDNR